MKMVKNKGVSHRVRFSISFTHPHLHASSAVCKFTFLLFFNFLPLTSLSPPKNYYKSPLRKPCTRKGNIRLIKIGDFDCVAYGRLHLDSIRNVKLVKAIAIEKIRGNARIAWKIGERAIADYRQKDGIISRLKPLLSPWENHFCTKNNRAFG
jgi:hypothetical protein